MGIIFLSFPHCLIQIILIGEAVQGGGGEGAVFLGSSPLEQKYIKHRDITCITYEIHVIPAVHPYAAFQGC